MNISTTNYTVRPTWAMWSIYTYSVLAAAIVITNGILVAVIARTESLRVNPHIYVLALGMADFSVGLIAIPITLTASNIKLKEYPQFCLAMQSVNFYSTLLSVGLLTLLAIDRCLFITKPLRYRILVTKFKSVVAIVTANIGIFLWSFAPLFGWNRLSLGLITENELKCSPIFIIMPNYVLVALIIYLFLETVQITCFSFIVYATWKHRRNLNQLKASTSTQSSRPVISLRATTVLALLVFTSAMGWIPLVFMNAADFDWFRSHHYVLTYSEEREVFLFIAYLTSLINPFVYGFGTLAVKKATAKMFQCKCCRRETYRTGETEVSAVTAL